MTIEELQQVEYHDSGLMSLQINFDLECVNIVFEKEVGQPELLLDFHGVTMISLDSFHLTGGFYSTEILDIDFKEFNDHYRVTINFNNVDNHLPFKLIIDCAQINLSNNA